MNTPTFNGRTVTRMHESTRRGAEYGCAIQRFADKGHSYVAPACLLALLALAALMWGGA